ncbi:2,3-diketo-5-methylthio-1-phosphopentane phosphatase [Absidia repens]|uniref:Enolase-phosphatase E1 n=1 Tax=Absidia repens TaxID=90262 RepID=A0A1X2IBW5_9FUNG|nr:2,3-diketo-5-methylthio-1-phosphopentane phosphatase [Absidia repens]
MASSTNCDTVILDIEGTITPITFVKDILFPYVTNGLDAFLDRSWGTTELNDHIQLLREQAEKDVTAGLSGAILIPLESSKEDIKSAVKQNIEWQMAADRKIGALKSFQGLMWRSGYESGELIGVVFDDVVPALKKWQSEGKKIYIYSSGSVPAQKLLVGYTEQGDLRKYFSGYFDTSVGLKVEAQSYLNIAQEIGIKDTNTILFVTDNINEIRAADQAGIKVIIADRPGNAPLDLANSTYKVVTSFDSL